MPYNKKLFRSSGFIIAIITIIAVPLCYVYRVNPTQAFWDNAMGNWIATVSAVVAGIPIAFWIDRRVKFGEEEQRLNTDRKKEKRILVLIREELDFSYNSLFLNGKKGNLITMTLQPLKSDLWDALMASQEIKYIEQPELLNRIVSGYYVLKLVRDIEAQAYIALRTSAISFISKDGSQKNACQLLLTDARGFDVLFEDNMREAIRAIDARLSVIEDL